MNHFILNNTYQTLRYSAEGKPVNSSRIQRDRLYHGKYLLHQLDSAWEKDAQQRAMFAAIKDRQGTYIEFQGAENYSLVTKSLENTKQGIRLLNVREVIQPNSVKTQSATVFIPAGKENYFNQRIQAYLDKEKNKDLVDSIETIKLAVISSFWTGEIEDIPDTTSVWCEYWLRADFSEEKKEADSFYGLCNDLGILHKDRCIVFPEKAVVMARTNRDEIQKLINASAHIAEIRRAPEVVDFYTKMTVCEADGWMENLKERLSLGSGAAYICILDTGVNCEHPLLENVLSREYIQTIDEDWGSDDRDGHGTNMAGVCEYFDLEKVLTSSCTVEISHRLESVKILKDANTGKEPELYGLVTSDAASLAEIANPDAKRVFCMAVTADRYAMSDGTPSSWSGELDNIICGVGDGIKKMFVVSAGNVGLDELKSATYPSANILHPVENPGQSWNAVTVGACTDKILVSGSDFEGWNPVAEAGCLSPFSSTSLSWDDHKWPVKPEILMEGGNVISDGVNLDICDDVSVLTTNRISVTERPFTTMNATSAATAQAAYMAAELMSRYPDLWEETIRALMVHSAEWTEQMKEQFCKDLNKTGGIKTLLRCCGYGVANLERAKESYDNAVNMIIQAELQPYMKENGSCKMKDMHIHEIPWPTDLLQSLGNTEVRMKVTLSYYIEAAPDQKGWNNKYRYASSALRFEVINKTQSKTDFIKRINVNARADEDKRDKGAGDAGADRWFLGKNNRDMGSIHSDVWTDYAVNMAECKYIAVYPVTGWWRERHNLGRINNSIRYSLIVSLSTPEKEIDFYTPIQTIIEEQIARTVSV